MNKALINFTKLNDANFLAKAQSIVSSMSENPNFPNPFPAIGDVQEATTILSDAMIAAATRNRVDVADKNEKRQTLSDLLKALAFSVSSTAEGNLTMLSSSGYDTSKQKEPAIITKPENPQVSNGLNSGELLASVKRVKGATSYIHQYATPEGMNTDDWQTTTTTQAKITYTDLEAGKIYYCRVGAVGSKGQIVYSDPISRMVI